MYQVYFCNHPSPLKNIKMKISPLDYSVMALFDYLQDNNYVCSMDNLYNSATFFRKSYTLDNRVMVHGVVRKGMQVIPDVVKQEEAKNQNKQIQVKVKVIVTVLQCGKECPDLVASSIYDKNPVHFLIMVCTEIKWVEKIKKFYNVGTGLIEKMNFLRMNNI